MPWVDKKRSPDERLMLAILAEALKDYTKIYRGKAKEAKTRAMKNEKMQRESRKRQAEIYLFSDTKESENYILGFKNICSYFGYDPVRLRKKLIEYMRREDD